VNFHEKNAALLIIDVQQGFDDPVWGERNNPQAEEEIHSLLGSWRGPRRPVFHVQHLSQSSMSPLRAGYVGNEFKDIVRPLPGESVIQKRVNSAFISTDLERRLSQHISHSGRSWIDFGSLCLKDD